MHGSDDFGTALAPDSLSADLFGESQSCEESFVVSLITRGFEAEV